MSTSDHNDALSFVYELSKTMDKDDLNYIYRGMFTQNIIVDILALTEKNIVKAKDPAKVRKKVYNLMVECLQNITKHQALAKEGVFLERNGLFSIQCKDNKYYITTGNLISQKKVEGLKSKLELVNSLNKEELKEHYRKQLVLGHISEQGGAGLGFIDMARKSGGKLFFDFKDIDNEYSFFYFRLQVASMFDEHEEEDHITDYSLGYITDIHKLIINHDIVLVYNNVFSEESQSYLLSYLQRQLAESVLTKNEVYNVMVEMMVNIVKHGARDELTTEAKPGIFFIIEKENEYQLNSGNYIQKEEVAVFKKKLDTINVLDKDKLDDLYKERIKKTKKRQGKKSGVGMIDMRLKSIKKFDYHFYPVNDNFSYFTLQVCVMKD
jgi:hypothetical protein